jgi:hypothetical protein
MPLNKKGKKIMKNMRKEYGSEKGKEVFYASKNKGTIKGVELEDDDFQQHEEVRGANSDAMKWLKARMDKKKSLEAKKKAAQSIRKDEAMTPEQKKKFEAGQKIFGKIKDFNPGAKKFRPTHAQNVKKSIKDHKFLAYKDLAYRMDELLGSMVAGAATALGSMGTKKVLGKSEKKKAEEKRKAELAAKQDVTSVDEISRFATGGANIGGMIKKADKTKTGRKVLKGTKEVARVAGMVPAVGAAGDAAALAISSAQRSGEKDPERRKKLGKEMAGDAAALVPGAGLATRGAQYAAKAGKAVRGTKAARKGSKLGKLRGRAGAAVRKHGATAAKAGEQALVQKLKDKSMEDETQMNSAYVNKLMENVTKGYGAGAPPHSEAAKKIAGSRASKKTQAAKDRAKAKKAMKDWTEYQRMGSLVAEGLGLAEGRRAYRGHRDVFGRKLSRPTPTKRTPEEAAAAAARGQAAHDKRTADRKAHMKAANEKNAAERAKRAAGQTLDPRTNKPK